jgi:hypothetical protein
MSNTNTLPDQRYIDQLRERLWSGREFGQAAVMVGAGFSRNAERISTSITLFPSWSELAERMYDSLYPPENLPEQDRETMKLKATSGVGVLKLASEYETAFSRPALDEFLLTSIPDNDYHPGHLHELLLSLPWSDVFTTNYDTLLERTLPTIHDRKYDLILTTSDIPGRMKPRIVKIHGSFPSHRPFIITEEDYRTYPKEFAPFMNMVQQAIMENAFCLIGFSGDDPNFLYWSGWVRDNLGEATPPVYLCGLLNLSTSQRRLLESRNIIPIDLSPKFPKSNWPDPGLRHAKALEWFLLSLMYGAPPNIMNWPTASTESIWRPSDGLPSPIPSPYPQSMPGKLHPDPNRPLETKDLEKLSQTWCQERLGYPGWVVAPKKNRETLWIYTENWIEPVLHYIQNLPYPENLFLLYELNWRLETTLTPLFMKWVEKIIPILQAFNPYPHLVEIKDATIRPDKGEYKQLDWKRIGECWVELVFALAREAREDQDEKRFRIWMDCLEKIIKQRVEWQIRWFYEECLFYVFRFDQEKIRKTLENWPERSDFPFWEAKRASILAELGELQEAEKLAEKALTGIRSRLQPYSTVYSLLSQEGWAMLLLMAIKDNKLGDERNFVGQYQNRWEKLGTYRCNPWPEIEILESLVKRPPPSLKPEKEIKREYAPFKVTETLHFASGLGISDFNQAFALLRIFEEGALPMRCGATSMFSDAVVSSAKWIAPFAPLWSLSSMVRTGKDTEIIEWFDYVRRATLAQDEVDHLYHLFLNSLTQAMRHLAGNPEIIGVTSSSFSQRQVTLLSKLLPRLCFRFSSKQLDELFKLTTNMYKQPFFRQYYILHSCVDNFFDGILYAMNQSEILQRIPELLSLPIPTEMGFEVSDTQTWIEPFNRIKWLEDTKLDPDFDRSAWSSPIANLIRVVKDGIPEARKRAVLRLERLQEIDGLTSEENKAFGEVLWSRIDPNKGLPSDTGLLEFAFLMLPQGETAKAKENFRKYLLSTNFPRVVQRSTTPDGKPRKSVDLGSQDNRYVYEWLGGTVPLFPQNDEEKQRFVDWTSDEVIQLLTKAVAWWDEEKGELHEPTGVSFSPSDILRDQFSSLIPLMAEVILPRLGTTEEKTNAKALKLLSEMEQSGFCVLSALPMILFVDPDSYDEIAQKVRAGLNSTKQEEVRYSIFGLFNWLAHGIRKNIATPPVDLLNELVNRVVTRRQPALNSAIGRLSVIVRRLPELLNEDQMESLCIALEYLIKETELPARQDREAISKLCTTIPIDERPEYRELGARLAYWLFVQFTSKNKTVPQILIKWKEICQSDPLPEVRRVWR